MSKAELVEYIARESGISKAAANKALASFIDGITKSLCRDQSVTLVGFGTFSVSERQARKGRNPRTGKPIQIAASKTARFKVGKSLKEAVNGQR